jgi:hypothetical protein
MPSVYWPGAWREEGSRTNVTAGDSPRRCARATCQPARTQGRATSDRDVLGQNDDRRAVAGNGAPTIASISAKVSVTSSAGRAARHGASLQRR